ncbi:hypothetical protein P7C70_g26, partial [Phenoliferia sp. Uapishka_3]
MVSTTPIHHAHARGSISLAKPTEHGVISVPYSPHQAPASPKLSKSSARSHLSPGPMTTLSRRATRINLPGGLVNSQHGSLGSLPSYSSSETDAQAASVAESEFPVEEVLQLQAAWSWFEETLPQGKLGAVRRNHSLPPDIAPYFGGYGTEAANWDSLVTFAQIDQQEGRGTMSYEREGSPSIPRRVLDIGCGIAAHWCLHMVKQPGWESTSFVGLIEIVETDFQLLESPSGSSDSTQILKQAIEAVYRTRFINNATLSPIRPALAINCSGTSGTTYTIKFPSLPPTPMAPSDPSGDEARVLLHAYAERISGISDILATDLTTSRILSRPSLATKLSVEDLRKQSLSPPRPANPPDPRVRPKSRNQMEREIRDVVAELSEDLVDRAGVARLVEERWGWSCAVDQEIEEVLEAYLPVFEQRLKEYEREEQRDQSGGWRKGEFDSEEVEFRKNQVTFAKREGEIELRAVKRRLGKVIPIEEDVDARSTLGVLTLHNWVARRP